MIVQQFFAANYRNLRDVSLSPSEGVNVIFGENGQGKTNLIESIWMFTGCHSFRTHRCSELVEKTQKQAKLQIDFSAHGMENKAVLRVDQKREFTYNGVTIDSPRRFLGEFQSVVFTPSTLRIVEDAPAARRRFLDIAVSMIKPAYSVHLLKYNKIMDNRNALLRQIAAGVSPESYLDPWDEELSKEAAKLTQYRLSYVDNLARIASEIHREISGGRETLRLEYIQSSKSVSSEIYALTEDIFMALQKSRETDLRRLATGVGPHKDDLSIRIDDLSARIYGSRGQQRSSALSLKLAEAYLIKEVCGEYPVILLDDVMSELDSRRQTFLLEYLKNWQVFLTCCDLSHFSKIRECKVFHMENGNCTEA